MSNEKQTSRKDAENNDGKDQVSESQTLTLLQGIKDRSVDPRSLCPADRRLLVSFLMAEGQSTAEIALLLKTSDRTIERDRKAIRDENAMAKDPKLAEKMAGMLCVEAGRCTQRIRKFQRDNDASAAAKMDGEHRCFQILCALSERLQSFGYLPIVTQRIEADIRHSAALSLSLEEILDEAGRLKQIQEMLPDDGTEHSDSSVEANETVAEFEDNSPRQDNKGENHETAK
ncbi:MAG: hypothetical protein CEE38_21515 [Planctomycetes bacterium B3_Pla]|nr:MAG: hypothetical protein CEE38_21515 [Planctomycetes bacterium B3_Pla]